MIETNISEEYHCLEEILTCLVCKGMVSQAHICPNCSKFYCLNCIIHQLSNDKVCLNCSRYLDVTMLVNCHKLCIDLTQTLAKVKQRCQSAVQLSPHHKSSLYCSKHKLEKTYYCQTCERPLCSDCSVLTSTHRGHDFIKLSIVKNAFQEKTNEMMHQIKLARSNIEKKISLFQENKHRNHLYGTERLPTFETAMRILKEHIKKNQKNIISQGDKNIMQMRNLILFWTSKYDEWMRVLRNCSKGKFIEQECDIIERDLVKILGEIDLNGLEMEEIRQRIKQKNVSFSYINPEYQEFTFVIEQFEQKRNHSNYFYTNSVSTKEGLHWRLKIYPNGIVKSHQGDQNKIENIKLAKKQSRNQVYFAVFIEFTEGPVVNTKQKHQLTLINQRNPTRFFSRQFQSEFDVGQCWGYEHYIKLSQLQDQGYINDELDSMEIILKISPISYYQATHDQLALINQKQEEIKRKTLLIENLEDWLSEKSSETTTSLSDIIDQGKSIIQKMSE